MKLIICKVVVYSIIIPTILNLTGCIQNSQHLKKEILYDSLQNMTDAYFSAEDVIAYAYLNSDLELSFNQDDCILYDSRGHIIDKYFLVSKFKWFVYIPKFACIECIINLSNDLLKENAIDSTAFITPYDSEIMQSIICDAEITQMNTIYINGNIGIPAEIDEVLFMFTMSNDFKFRNIYVPNNNHRNLTKIYLNIVRLKNNGIKSQIGSISRATQLSELEAEAIMRPLVDDGIQLRDQIIEQVELDPSQT